jgi:hypothetical protein
MKHLFLLPAFLLLSHTFAFSQSCLPQGITFTTQAQIDNFQANYPGCTEIKGDVIINGSIFNLNGLNVLKNIEGDLHFGPTGLIYMGGIESLKSIEGNLIIQYNDNLISLNGLDSLQIIGGGIAFEWNLALQDISALKGLLSVYSIYFYILPELTDISCFQNIDSVYSIFIEACPALGSLEGLNALQNIPGFLSIGSCDALQNLNGLNGIQQIGGFFQINNNLNLMSLEGLNSIEKVFGDLSFADNENLINLSALSSLDSIGGRLGIYRNINLTTLSGLENIAANTITELHITQNFALPECNVKSVCDYLALPNGIVYIEYNAPGCNSPEEVQAACLTSLEEKYINNDITISPNPATDFLTINTKVGFLIEETIIYNHFGQKVLVSKPVNNTVDVSKLMRGIYFLEVITSQNRIRTKLVIE